MGNTKFDFSGQTVMVTGGTRGIGKGIAEGFVKAGAFVYILGTNEERGKLAEENIRGRGGHVRFLRCDVTQADKVNETFERVGSEAGRIDVLVNNAGGWAKQQPITETPEEEWDRIVALNLKSVFLCSKAVIPIFRRQKRGRIINIGSIGGLTTVKAPSPMRTFSSPPYIVSKAGVHAITRLLAAELGGEGIVVNALVPGTTATERVLAVRSEEQRTRMAARTLPGRIAELEEVVGWALFLAAPESSYLMGQTITVNGGRLMV
jgi:NAD(P)-dependent dehydrogenase (short-subunit alcohol dehydrogenase family)